MKKQTINALIGLVLLLACWAGVALSEGGTELSNQNRQDISLSSRLINK